MNEIYLSNIQTPEHERVQLIRQLDDIFKNEQLVMSIYHWSDCYFPIKSIQHFIENSPTYKAEPRDLIVWFQFEYECLTIKNVRTCRSFHIRLANKKYKEDFPYIYEGKLSNSKEYIIPIKFK